MKTIQTKKTNKRLSAEKLLDTYNSYEVRKVKIETILKKMFWDKNREQWRIIGHAHDYSC